MDAESSICLSDLVPALRWSRPQQVAEVLADPRLPAGWWASVGITRALGTAGIEWISERLARLCGYGIYQGLIGHIDKHDPIDLLRSGASGGMVWDAI